ncbi:MAG: uncharacterized protein QOG64_2874 [Acidimicrobiaceae bacterium]|nr:uncharacterized protein [Acidimicrobiaceae bacterium]
MTPSRSGPAVTTAKAVTAISADDARRLALAAQGLLGAVTPAQRRAGASGMLRRLGAVQLDTISVLARSHELVPYARLGPVGRRAVEDAYWGGGAFEYWAHAACILPVEDWPWFAGRRARYRGRGVWNHRAPQSAIDEVRKRLADGPVTATELGGAKKGGPWWDWSEVKVAAERLLAWGDIVCVRRQGWKRVYDLPERVIPNELLELQPSDEECNRQLVQRAGARLGVATRSDLADYYRLKKEWVDATAEAAGLVPVRVDGWREATWADPVLLATLAAGQLRGRHRTTLLSPFDSLVWDRARTERVFVFAHRLEAYVPAPKRVHGYFAMPLLAGGKLLGRVDPGRSGRTMVAKQASLASAKAVPAMAAALVEAASWVGCDTVAVERVDPPELKPELLRAVAAAQPD